MVKLSFPLDSQFDSAKAIELANLIQRAYEDYKNFKSKAATLHAKSITTGSERIVDLYQENGNNEEVVAIPGDIEYEIVTIFRELIGEDNHTPIGFIARRKNNSILTDDYYVIFRGTMEKDEWKENFKAEQTPLIIDNTQLGNVATGFSKIYKTEDTRDNFLGIDTLLQDTFNPLPKATKIFVSGHSLGGALATLATRQLLGMGFQPILYTYASPRVGGGDIFVNSFATTNCYRVFNSEDIVPYVPLATFEPFGEEMRLHQPNQPNQPNQFIQKRVEGLISVSKILGLLHSLHPQDLYTHVGESICFTDNRGSISMNHNMYETYREALKNE